MDSLVDQVVVVTGASAGIGRALCHALAERRARVVLAARNEARLQAVAAECESRGAATLVVPTDVTDETACRHLVERAVTEWGRLDALVANAGQTMWARFEELEDLAVFEQLMRVNYLGCVYCTHAALPHLRRARGRLVGIASVAGLTGVPTRTAYAATKHAMFGFLDSLRVELAESGVSVTVVAPDFVRSEIHERALGPDGKPLGTSPMQAESIMTAEECAQLILRAMLRRQRLLVTSRRGRAGRWLKLLAPGLLDRIAAKAIRERK